MMRSLASLAVAAILSLPLAAVGLLTQVDTADAAFHCMRIHAVAGGIAGNNNIQFVELRMDLGGQNLVGGHKIDFFDATSTLKATFTFPSHVPNGALGDSVLIATQQFKDSFLGGTPDFIFDGNTVGFNGGDPRHPVQVPGGLIVFSSSDPLLGPCGVGSYPIDALAYGAATPIYSPAAIALPNPGTLQALRLSNLAISPIGNNAYSLDNIPTATSSVAPANLATNFTTPRNNQRQLLVFVGSVGGVAQAPAPATSAENAGAGGDATPWFAYGGAAFVAAAALAAGASWYAYRRRTR